MFYTQNDRAVTAPAEDAIEVTPSDVTVLEPTRGIYVGGAGHLTVRMMSGRDVTFSNIPGGTLLPIRVTQVRAATTATLIDALW